MSITDVKARRCISSMLMKILRVQGSRVFQLCVRYSVVVEILQGQINFIKNQLCSVHTQKKTKRFIHFCAYKNIYKKNSAITWLETIRSMADTTYNFSGLIKNLCFFEITVTERSLNSFFANLLIVANLLKFEK